MDEQTRDVDWEAIERSPEFQELVHKRRAFVIPGTIFFLTWYMGFILLAGYAEDFMAESVYEGLTVGYSLALTQFLMVGVLGIWYLRKSEKVFDPLAQAAIAAYERDQNGGRRSQYSPGERLGTTPEERTPAGSGAPR